MDELQKAAVVLLSLDKALAAEVLSLMSKEDVEKVTMKIAKMSDVSKEQQASVLNEFTTIRSEQTSMERGGLDAVNELLEQSLGKEGAGSILDSINQSMNSVPFGFLQKSGATNLLTFIIEEHPQTIAMIMSHLPSNLAAEVLAGLPSNKQIDVIKRISNMEQTSPEVVRDVEKSLEHRMKNTFSQGMENAGGVELVAEILNVTDRMTNKGILENMDQDTPDLADEIRRLMFVFDDLVKLDSKAIQSLLKEVETNQWAVALKGASEEIKQKVLSNLSQRAADLLREEMEYLGPIRVSDVEAVQQQIVDSVRRLEDAGEIDVASGNENEQYIT